MKGYFDWISATSSCNRVHVNCISWGIAFNVVSNHYGFYLHTEMNMLIVFIIHSRWTSMKFKGHLLQGCYFDPNIQLIWWTKCSKPKRFQTESLIKLVYFDWRLSFVQIISFTNQCSYCGSFKGFDRNSLQRNKIEYTASDVPY